MAFARSVARRIRNGVRRRVDRVLDRWIGEEPVRTDHAATDPAAEPMPVATSVVAAPAAAAPEPAPEPVTDTVGPPLTREQVEVLFEEMVRPALQSDGGDITLVKVESNDVYVELVGACQTCPSSIVTMQQGIQRLLEEEFPQFGRLIRVNG